MNKQLISILRLVAVCVLAASKILAWVGGEHTSVPPNYYLIIVPVKPHATAQRFGEERMPAQLWSM